MTVICEFRTKSTGNPWFICTLWLADYRIAVAKQKEDLKGALEILEWTCKRALASGVLAEQVNPHDGEARFGCAANLVAFNFCRNGDELFEETSQD